MTTELLHILLNCTLRYILLYWVVDILWVGLQGEGIQQALSDDRDARSLRVLDKRNRRRRHRLLKRELRGLPSGSQCKLLAQWHSLGRPSRYPLLLCMYSCSYWFRLSQIPFVKQFLRTSKLKKTFKRNGCRGFPLSVLFVCVLNK